jgi:hypothetical protein
MSEQPELIDEARAWPLLLALARAVRAPRR